MMCIHGGAGFGKTLAVNTCLRELEPGEDVRRVTFRPVPPPVRCATNCSPHSTWPASHRATQRVRPPAENSSGRTPRTFLVDEAQWLNGEAFEYFRYLWDEPSTQLAIIFVGGEGCHTVLRREPMLSSRIFIWQHFTRLTPARSSTSSPVPPDLGPRRPRQHRLRRPACRARQLPRLGPADRPRPHRPGTHRPPRVDQELLRWAFSRLA
ncbi:ATP-binding protein [Streptomyces sp. M10(2022)]